MSTKISKFKHLQGEDAYLIYWLQIYRFKISLSMIKALQLNLEIIIDDAGDILAYRSDLPHNMKMMLKNDGQWYINHKENISQRTRAKLKQLFVMLRFNACSNTASQSSPKSKNSSAIPKTVNNNSKLHSGN